MSGQLLNTLTFTAHMGMNRGNQHFLKACGVASKLYTPYCFNTDNINAQNVLLHVGLVVNLITKKNFHLKRSATALLKMIKCESIQYN